MKNRLSEQEYGEVFSCIEAIYRCRSLDDFPRQVLIEMRKLIDCNHSGYNEVNLTRNRALIVFEPTREGLGPLFKNFEKLMHEHPVINYFQETGDGQALKISDFLGVREFHKLALYRDLYQPLEAEDQISFAVKVEPGFIIGIAFNRNKRSFTEKDRMRLNLVRPHIIQAYLHASEIAGHEEQRHDLQMALKENGLGVIALNNAGHIIHSTPGACERLAVYMPFTEAGESDDENPLSKELLQWALADDHIVRGSEPFVVRGATARLIIRRVRHEDRTLLLLGEESKVADINHLQRFQITPRESEVLQWIAEGKSNAEIAMILKMTEGTVKIHVGHILAKLGVENRTAAAAVAYRNS